MKTVEAARGRWKGIITMLGGNPEFLENRHQKCPFCGGKDRFRFDDREGEGTYFCSGCGAGNGMDFVMAMRGWDFARAAKEVDSLIGRVIADEPKQERTERDKSDALRFLLGASTRIYPGCPAWIYLGRRCGTPEGILGELWQHPGLKHGPSGETFPALLSVLRYPDGRGACIHRTFLTAEGFKAPVDPVRMMMPAPRPIAGSAIRLGPVTGQIGVAEGLETAICAGKLHNLPVWSAISANTLMDWEVPEGVRSIVIFGDNDGSLVGQAAAYVLGRKLRAKGFDVEVRIPPGPGDWADVWANQEHKGEV